MPRVSREEVERLAGLARIRLTDAELDRFTQDLGNILEHVTDLEKAEPAPVTYAAPEHNRFRPDTSEVRIGELTARDAFPDTDGKFLKVPRVF